MRFDRLCVCWMVLVFLVGCAFQIGVRTARADPIPNPCLQFKCKEISYFWGGSATIINAYFQPGGANIGTSASQDIFTLTSTTDNPPISTNNTLDVYTYAACVPQCGQDANGVWQAPQEVTPIGNKSAAPILQNWNRFTCTALAFGVKIGPTNANPVNSNAKDKHTPPGWTP